jgi:FkbM family methyltransferase
MKFEWKFYLLKILGVFGFSRHRLYYLKERILNRKSYSYVKDSSESVYKTIRIGNRDLDLDLRAFHEKQYYLDYVNTIPDVDGIIAKRLLRNGDTVLDAGANIGFTALTYLELGAKTIYAFEPMPSLFQRLSKLADDNLYVSSYALSNEIGKAQIISSLSHNQGSTLNKDFVNIHPGVFGEKLNKVEIQTTTLDEVCKEVKFDFMKVDIEGHEIPFVKGADHLLSKRPPRILQIEVYDLLFDDTNKLLLNYFMEVRRVVYNKATSEANFVHIAKDYSELIKKGFQIMPPNYIYTNDPTVF